MTEPNESANGYGFCTANGDCVQEVKGLTKREYFAAMALQGMCSRQTFVYEGVYEQIAKQAVLAADYLIEKLNKNN